MRNPALAVVLSLRDVAKRFGAVHALKSMHLDVRAGRVHALLGENGAGKSTLMKILAGVYPASGGHMTLEGCDYVPKNPQEASARGLCIVFQELSLCNNLSVAENIFATHEPHWHGFINKRRLYHKAERLIEDLGLPIDPHARVGSLSIARRQLVEIAKGLSRPAKVLILDEPTSSLSDAEAEILFNIIDKLKTQGVAIIYISHRMEEIRRLADDITVMRDGEYVGSRSRENTSTEELIALMVGREVRDIYPPPLRPSYEPTGTGPILCVDNLSSEGKFQDVSFKLFRGEILGFFGLVGAGRSDVMNALFGCCTYRGTVRLLGEELVFRHPADAIKAGVGFVTENRKEEGLVLGASVLENISIAALKNFAKSGFIQFSTERQAGQAVVRQLAIRTHSLETRAGTLSGGNQQKIVLAKWLLTRPRLLILDEPTRGVDVGAKLEIYRLIRKLAAEGTAILLVSSELPELLGLSSRVIVMAQKRVVATLEGVGLTPERIMNYATASL